MYSFRPIIIDLLKKLGIVFAIYTLSRILFFLFNTSAFQGIEFTEFAAILFYGLRFDIFSIFATNSLFIFLSVLPFPFYYSKWYQGILKYVFFVFNIIPLLFNFIDVAYFPYIQKRSTLDVVNLMFGGRVEFLHLVPHFLKDNFILSLCFIGICILMIKGYNYVSRTRPENTRIALTFKSVGSHFSIFTLVTLLTVLGIRGGLQKIPIVLIDAANYSKPKYIPLILNTPFSIIKSSELSEMKELDLIPEKELGKYVDPIHPADSGQFKNTNVCIIILESFSKEFTGIGNRTSYTPFLDSLMKQSLWFSNAYANGKSSSEGIASIVASIPSYMQDQYINSVYGNNVIQTLPGLLKKKGYSSTFFHGGTNGTMNFNSFTSVAGFDNYYGRSEYNNDADYDGQWGIWDDAFLKKVPHVISEMKEPFFTTLFTLSSHNPYKVPEAYTNKYPKGNLEIIESIGYADHSLRLFFEEAKKQKWFNNTLFIISADHTAVSDDKFYANQAGQFSIPIFIYKSDMVPSVSHKPTQQIDIMPTVLDYLNYDEPYYAFGKSAFSDKKDPIIYFTNPYYYLISDSLMYVMGDFKFREAYNFKTDSILEKSILMETNAKEAELLNFAKAQIQTYTNDIIKNRSYYGAGK